jgi:hypothetical protein
VSRIIRVSKRANYSTIDNHFVNDGGLSWQATGLLTYLLSKPDHWSVSIADLVKRKTDGRFAVMGILRELEDAGYLKRERTRWAGKFTCESTVYEQPQHSLNINGDSSESNHVRFPDAGKPTRETAPVVSTEEVKTEKKKTRSAKPAFHPDAEGVYAAYPRKVAKPAALKAITAAVGRGYAPDVLLAKTRQYARAVLGKDMQYVPHPATWFNQDRFNDLADSPSSPTPKAAGDRGKLVDANKQIVRVYE